MNILADESDHAEVDRNDFLSALIEFGKGVGLIAFDDVELALHVGRAANAKMRQRHLLDRSPPNFQNDLLVVSQ